jgi:CDP-diacylglycerol---serine O-phosphatidyltransferase
MQKNRILRRPRMVAVLPTMLTLANAVCGFGAITFAAKVGLPARESLVETLGWKLSDANCLAISGLLIFLAMLFDALDGSAARWAKQTSPFGAQLDSLCDAISFGVAPAFILIKFSPDFHAKLLWMIAALFVVCVILRLARFNVETEEDDTHEYFSGLPSPAAAGTIASFMIAIPELQALSQQASADPNWWERATYSTAAALLPAIKFLLPLMGLACAGLMVSRVRYAHVFNQWFRGRRSYHHVVQLVIGIAAVVMIKEIAVPLLFCGFALGSPLRALWNVTLRRHPAQDVASAELPPPPEEDSQGH